VGKYNQRRMMPEHRCGLLGLPFAVCLTACMAMEASSESFVVSSDAGVELRATPLAEFEQPWAMTFLPDARLLVTEKPGRLLLVSANGAKIAPVAGLPPIEAEGQGGLGDVILHPLFAGNSRLYISYVEREDGKSGAAVASATLISDASPRLTDFTVIWRQEPKVSGNGHYGHRLAFSVDGDLYITSGERQKFSPAQDLAQNLGKIIRLAEDGSVPADNPFQSAGDIARQVWSLGHRNPLGIAFDASGQLWVHEMGPRGGDELNLIQAGGNYGYPIVSNGDHYNGTEIPDHDTRPDLDAPQTSWNPVISPAGFVIYDGQPFAKWQGFGLLGGLSSKSLVRVSLVPGDVREVERYDMPRRVREVEQGPDGFIYVLEDRSGGRLLRLTPMEVSADAAAGVPR